MKERVFAGQRVHIAGKFPSYRTDELARIVREQGGEVARRLSKRTALFLCGAGVPSKKRSEADRLGVATLRLEDFLDQLDPSLMTFCLDGAEPSLAPSELAALLEAKNWGRYDGSADDALCALLDAHEASHGVGEVHHLCTRRLWGERWLECLHPWWHTAEIASYDLSPDGRWFATSCWHNPDTHDDPLGQQSAQVQVWDVELGRPVASFPVRYCVGWRDRNGMRWSPDSRHLAMSFDTNGVGVWNPFAGRGSDRLIAYAHITDGWSRPPAFRWSADSEHVYIECPHFHALGTNDPEAQPPGTWMPIASSGSRSRRSRADAFDRCVAGAASDRALASEAPIGSSRPPKASPTARCFRTALGGWVVLETGAQGGASLEFLAASGAPISKVGFAKRESEEESRRLRHAGCEVLRGTWCDAPAEGVLHRKFLFQGGADSHWLSAGENEWSTPLEDALVHGAGRNTKRYCGPPLILGSGPAEDALTLVLNGRRIWPQRWWRGAKFPTADDAVKAVQAGGP